MNYKDINDNEDIQYLTEYDSKVLEKENDFYNLTKEEWKRKYGIDKPKNKIDIYRRW